PRSSPWRRRADEPGSARPCGSGDRSERRRRWRPSAASRRDDREGLPSPDRRGRRQLGPAVVDFPLREALQELVEGDPPLEAGEGGAEAEVHAVAEREVLADLAMD